MFVEGGDPLDVPVESLTVIPAFDPEHREGEASVGCALGRGILDPSPSQVGCGAVLMEPSGGWGPAGTLTYSLGPLCPPPATPNQAFPLQKLRS